MLHSHASVIVDEKEILVLGGGGNCFSFGTHFNKGLSFIDLLPSNWCDKMRITLWTMVMPWWAATTRIWLRPINQLMLKYLEYSWAYPDVYCLWICHCMLYWVGRGLGLNYFCKVQVWILPSLPEVLVFMCMLYFSFNLFNCRDVSYVLVQILTKVLQLPLEKPVTIYSNCLIFN